MRPMLIGSLLLHLCVLVMLFVRFSKPREALTPPGVAMVFESGSRNGPAVPKPNKGHEDDTSPPTQVAPSPAPPASSAPPPPPTISPAPLPEIAPSPAVPQPVTPSVPPPPSVSTVPVPAPPAPMPLEAPTAPPSAAVPQTPAPEPPAVLHRPAPPLPRLTPRLAPQPAPRPVPRVEPRREPRAASPFPMPMDFSFGNAASRASPHDSSAAPTTLGPSARESYSAISQVGSSIQPIGHPTPGGGWANALQAWVKEHAFYPRQAAMNAEEGPVVLRLVIDQTGRVNSVELISRSGSQWLDLGAQSIFRGAHVPPFPPDSPYSEQTLDYTLNYIIIRR